MRLIDAEDFQNLATEKLDMQDMYLPVDVMKLLDEVVEVEAIPVDDNFGLAAYIIENSYAGVRVEEAWNLDLDDEEMLAVMAGIIEDIMRDERLTKLWSKATQVAKFMVDRDARFD